MITELLAEPAQDQKRSFYTRHQTTIILASCMLLGLVLRVAQAGRSGICWDEAQFLWIVRIPSLPGMLDFLWHHESHPPLFYILMRVWLSWFGDSEVAALALPVLLGVFLIPVTHRVGDRVFSPQTGLIAAIFVAVSPMLAHYSGMVRPYSLLPLLCLLSVYGLWDGLRGRRARPWVFYVIATLAMLLTHNWAWIVLAAQWILVACLLAWPSERPARPLLVAWALAQFALLAAYSPWLPVLLYQSRHAGYDAFPWNLLDVFTYFTETVVSLPVQAAIPVCIMLIVTAAWRAAQRSTTILPKNERRRSALLLFIGIPLLAFGVANVLSTKTFLLWPRCMTAIAPCVLIAIAYGIASLSSMPRVVTLVFTSIYIAFTLKDLRDIKSNAREAAALVSARAQPTDLIVITPVWCASPFNYYYTLGNPQSNYPHDECRGAIDYDDMRARLLDPRSMAIARERLVQAHREERRVWLVTASGTPDDDVPDSDRLPASLKLSSYVQVGRVRANQLRKQLNTLYDMPDAITVPIRGRAGLESFNVLLYTRNDQSLRTEGGQVSRSTRHGG